MSMIHHFQNLQWQKKASPDAIFPDVIHGVGKASSAFPMPCTASGKPLRQAYRATLLRNRFADTILKAREKLLEKGDKRDPKKVRIEREELEKQQREGWRRAMDEGRLKMKLRPRRGTATTMEWMAASYGRRRMFLSSPNPFPFVFSSM
ncbi:Transcription factor GTE10 [Cucumis melo var. makuwa]|uniref:Transcription factor GTE10 n=1 Tax=Cucumis melo var. makuwa TaxID=1194695 RepID=A0A5A7T0D3_CUCMM|nr:Transcription factor GTE10 [Cucumis melo var. makuwa]TYK02370.1 Transcription factor GTE10 [Cucumis melo var. makuwa]